MSPLITRNLWRHIPISIFSALPVLIAGLLLLPAPAAAQTCGSGPTLKTITVDGDPSDWAPVLANPQQLTNDDHWTADCVLSTDRDCLPGKNIDGKDLNQFAWTYDANNIYMYVDRFGISNIMYFFFYLDLNSNRRMDSTDKVLQIFYRSTNTHITATLFDYIPADPVNGDSLVATSGLYTGYADGYEPPGLLPSTGTVLYDMLHVGFDADHGFEAYVPFSALGVTPGTIIYYHVASSNTTIAGAGSPKQLDDNLGGPDDKIGSFGHFNWLLAPNHSTTIPPGFPASTAYLHTLSNTGTLDDHYNLDVVSTQGFRVDLYDNAADVLMGTDLDGNSVWDYVNPAYDFNGDNHPDATIAAAGSFAVRVVITTLSGVEGVVDVTTLHATSIGNALCAPVTATDTTTVQLFPPGLMRNAALGTLTPSDAEKAAIFPRAPGDPSLAIADIVVTYHNSGDPFPTDAFDYSDTTAPIVFYQTEHGSPVLHVAKDTVNNKLVITH